MRALVGGSIIGIYEMQAINEKFVELAGKTKRVWKESKNIKESNGISFRSNDMTYFVGNINGSRVEEILSDVLEKDYLNVVNMGLQQVRKVAEIQEGVPYMQVFENETWGDENDEWEDTIAFDEE